MRRKCGDCGSTRIITHEWFWFGEPSMNCKCQNCGLIWPEFPKPKKKDAEKLVHENN